MSFINDMDMAALEFDVKAAQDVLTMFADAGKEPVLGVFQETAVGALLAFGLDAVAVVDEDRHS